MNGLKNVRNRRDDPLSRVAWDKLETLLALYYRGQGYQVEHVGTGATRARFDGGIDLKLRRDDQYIVVQCKHWNAQQVPHNDVHQLLGLMVNEGATGAILITSGEFTKAAIEAATRQGHVQLIDGDELRAMLGPLPEPDSPNKVEGLAAHVGERLLRATEDRIRGGGRRGSVTVQSVVTAALAKAALSIVLIIFILLVFQSTVRSVLQQLSRPNQAQTSTLPPAANPQAPAAASQMIASKPGVDSDPCHEVIDRQSGTYIDHCAKPVPRKPPSAAEIREQQRKADEAMKVIEDSTPEI